MLRLATSTLYRWGLRLVILNCLHSARHPIGIRRCLQRRNPVILCAILLLFYSGTIPTVAAKLQAPTFTVPSASACSSNKASVCATFSDGTGKNHEVVLFSGSFTLIDSALMGTYPIASAPHQLAYLYGTTNTETLNGNAWVSVIDLTTDAQIAFVASPAGYNAHNTYFQYIVDPSGNKYPFIAPGSHYLEATDELAAKRAIPWDTLCLFDPAYIVRPDPACYTGFKHYSTTFTTPAGKSAALASGFRHDGGWVEDVDGDGWSDINLPYLQYILTISGKTGKQLGLTHFDVAKQSEPTAPAYFHSGRFYGSFVAFPDPDTGGREVLFASGNAVGTFADYNCNVSRYFAVGQWQETTLDLKWSDFLSFSKTIFNPPYNSISNYSRLGDELNKCAHRYGTSLTHVNNRPYVIFDLFTKDNPAPECQAEILAEQAARFTNVTTSASNLCGKTQAGTVYGKWAVHILDAGNGKDVVQYPNQYVWGDAPNVIPGQTQLLLVQQFTSRDGDVRFDQTGAVIDSLALVSIKDGPSLSVLASITSPSSAPKIAFTGYRGAYASGMGASWGGIPQLVLKDIDGDGLNDIELQDGRWLGYSASTDGLVIKTVPSH